MNSNPYSPSQVADSGKPIVSTFTRFRHPAIFVAWLLAGALLPILGFAIAESVDNFGSNLAWLLVFLPALLAGITITVACWYRAHSRWQRVFAFWAISWSLLLSIATLMFAYKFLMPA
ncbi:MAG: hypothetical protein P8L85_10315 [Rubripirellula sp.]|nr:hypothetical protein [Rubripirellula sp.]